MYITVKAGVHQLGHEEHAMGLDASPQELHNVGLHNQSTLMSIDPSQLNFERQLATAGA